MHSARQYSSPHISFVNIQLVGQSVGQLVISNNHPTSSFPFREREQKEEENREEENMKRRKRGKWGVHECA